MRKKIIKLLLLFISSIFLSGCWDLLDIERRTIIISAGIDKEGEDIVLTQESTSMFPPVFAKTDGKNPSKINVESYKGTNFEEITEKSIRRQPFPAFTGAVRVVVFGPNFAKEDISSFINRIDRSYEYRKSVIPVVSREPAKDIISFNTSNDVSVGFLIERTVMDSLYRQHFGLHGQLGRVIHYESIPEVGYLIQYVGIEDNDLSVLGLAAIVDGKMVRALEGDVYRGAVYLIAEKFAFYDNLINPGYGEPIVFKTLGGKRKISTDYIDGTVHININLDTQHMLMYQYNLNPISESSKEELESKLAKKIKSNIEEAIRVAQEDVKFDIYQLALYFRGQHPKIYKTLNWKEAFQKAKIKVTVSSEVTKKNLYDPNVKEKR